MLADQLEILLITFNRAPELRHTLTRLVTSPFAECRVTVLDNRSTDDTPEVCDEFRERLAGMRVVRHAHNIGGNANYLRAVELATAPYAWVLADDDDLDFSDCGDVTEAVERGDIDLISVGAPAREHWRAGRTTMRRLLADEDGRVLHVFNFIPNTIFRRESFDDRTLRQGYDLVENLYPQMALIFRELERNASVLVSRRQIVIRGGITTPSSELFWFLRWVRTCSHLKDRAVRRAAIYGKWTTRREWARSLVSSVAQERLYFPERAQPAVLELIVRLEGDQRLWMLAVAPLAWVPPRIYDVARRLRKRLQGQPVSDRLGGYVQLDER